MEVLYGEPSVALRSARGRWVAVMPTGVEAPSGYADAILRAAVRFTAIVPAVTGSMNARELMTAAVCTPGTAFPARAARAAGLAYVLPADQSVAHRARALAALNRVPLPAAVPAPTATAPRPADADGILAAAVEIAEITAAGPRVRRALEPVPRLLSAQAGAAVRNDQQIRRSLLDRYAGLTGVDVRALNESAARDLAVLYAFPPALDTGGFVTARRLAIRGDAYDVVVQEMGTARPRDERARVLSARDEGRRMTAKGPVSAGAWAGIATYCRNGMEMIDARIADAGPYRNLYSRSMWIAPSVLAAWYKVRHPEVEWTAEVSDPLSLRTNGLRRPDPLPDDPIIAEIAGAIAERGMPGPPSGLFFDAVEWMIYSLADRIVFTNENQRQLMLDAYPDPSIVDGARERSEIDPHPTPEASLYGIGSSAIDGLDDVITIGYFGTFYDVRSPDDLLAPLRLLGEAERARLRLVIFTGHAGKVRAEVEAAGLSSCVEVRDALGYFDFLATAKAMDWLVVADAHRPASFPINPYLPSKYADYRGSGARIWGMVDDGSVLSQQPLDARSPIGDAAGAAAVLRETVLGVTTQT